MDATAQIFLQQPLSIAKRRSRLTFFFLLIASILLSRAILPPLLVGVTEEVFLGTANDPFWLNLVYNSTYFLIGLASIGAFTLLLQSISVVPLFVMWIAYALVILPFAKETSLAFSETIQFTLSMLFAVLMVKRSSFPRFILFLAYFGLAIFIASISFMLLLPEYGFVLSGDRIFMRGAFENKNTLGLYGSWIAPLAWLLARSSVTRHTVRWYLLAGIATICVIGSGAVTSWLIWLLLVFCIILDSAYRRSMLYGTFAAAILLLLAAIAGIIIFAYTDDILALLGKDPTLTGRTAFFKIAWNEITNSPLIGTAGAPLFFSRDGIESVAGTAHNGHINIIMRYGILGGMFYLSLLFSLMRVSINTLKEEKRPIRLVPLLFTLFWLLSNIAEDVAGGVFFWSIFLTFIIGNKQWHNQSST
jgi:exopolysaccharide production protein ExoQ